MSTLTIRLPDTFRKRIEALAVKPKPAAHTYAATAFSDAPTETPRHVCLLGAYGDEFPEPPGRSPDVNFALPKVT